MANIGSITRDELKQKIDRKENFHLVEALAPEKFIQAHLPAAINIPYDRVRELAPQLLPDKNAEIVTYCAAVT
jgi:rhodanese-related sulfurtransferase